MKQPESIENCTSCTHSAVSMSKNQLRCYNPKIGKCRDVEVTGIPSWCPLQDAVEIKFTREEVNKIVMGGEDMIEYASYQREYIEEVTDEINQAINDKLRNHE